MHAEVERELTYLLLVELLAYQFASPVKWIETQDVLLKELHIQNLLEVGPASTLVNMLKRTLQHDNYIIHDSALGLTRKLLSYRDHAATIHRGFTASTDLKAITAEPSPPSSTEPSTVAALPIEPVAPPPAAVEIAAQPSIPDAPVPAQAIVVAIISQKLDRALGKDDLRKSVKQLCGGRSTMENEITGELEAEFGSVPEHVESIELQAVCDQLQASPAFSGQLRRTTTVMIAKMTSLKMAGDFRTAQIRSYLESRWGLGPGRQDCILLQASSRPPEKRLATAAETREFLDAIAQEYFAEHGLNASPVPVPLQSAPVATSVAGPREVDTARQSIEIAQLEEQAGRLGIDLHQRAKVVVERDEQIQSLQRDIDALVAELGEDLISGVQPQWSASHIRRYDSYWNWGIQDLFNTLGAILRGEVGVGESWTRQQARLIANRACPRLLRVVQYLHRQTLDGKLDGNIDAASSFLASLTSSAERQSPPTIRPFAQNVCERRTVPRTIIGDDGEITYEELPCTSTEIQPARVTLSIKNSQGWCEQEQATEIYTQLLKEASGAEAPTFADKVVLLIGASRSSIGSEILRGLLVGGANVIVTTSRFTTSNIDFFREMYVSHGARGSQLHVVSFNQGSHQDVNSLIGWIYDGLGLDLDHVVPFAAISESGREMDKIDSRAELAHRMMLVNVLRLMGRVAHEKRARGYNGNVTQVLLPLSPNHGTFGGDGLYAESKIGFEPLFAKWESESWAPYLSICGASIGWTRGTGLMKANDLVAEGMEKMGIRTFSVEEMALHLLLLMSNPVAERCETAALYADVTGGLGQHPNLKSKLSALREEMQRISSMRKAVMEDQKLDASPDLMEDRYTPPPPPLANLQLKFPALPDYDTEIRPLSQDLRGMVDLDRVVVVTGIAELGPHGNARTRWEMEADGHFSLEGCIEMAWMMGMIRHYSGEINSEYYDGWVDVEGGHPVADSEVKSRYEKRILEHTGIRLVEPELDIGYGPDPTRRQLLQEVVLTEDLPPISTSKELATHFQAEQGDLVDVYYPTDQNNEEDDVRMRLKKGATILVPKGLKVAHPVAGQIPTGWNPKNYGLSDELIAHVDRVTLFTLVCVAEALFASGLTDAYELYRYIHVSELGNCIGSGLGGIHALKRVFRTRHHDLPAASDILQETFINTAPAWVNMLLMSGAGPLRTPVGACATALESLDSGYELISTGKAKVCLVGGVDDLDHDIAVEFANMGATSDAAKEHAQGRSPAEASRPTSSTRAGFVETHGAGVQLLTTARLALDMGLPVYGVIAWAGTASDKAGRSVPAPGQGLLTNARETAGKFRSPLLNMSYRRRRLDQRLGQISKWEKDETADLTTEDMPDTTLLMERQHWITNEASRQRKDALATFGLDFWHGDSSISPIRGALAVWGLTVNDLDFASLHGTSTVLNDLNETDVIQKQLSHLGREDGHLLYCIFQKYLTGHSKGASAAWMVNGCFQALNTGTIPGQRNADNIDVRLRARKDLFFPSKTIRKTGLKAFSVTSFGFGQKGAQAFGVHPRYVFAAATEEEYHAYCVKVQNRQKKASQVWAQAMAEERVCDVKDSPPWGDGMEMETMLNPLARF
ncbi:hypothetical protein PENPOL_c017G03948 [Penicillium polonicum]|uniref:Ketosynthase family 3 (KS3) domain-containing protein n=1 Tax=Penicillium polonicum TaxID=60169 RepID=A0A1V6N9F7_PENPO|nr:hypothetical protein PENPOL_c017G03948 [Penicillium polonicum]